MIDDHVHHAAGGVLPSGVAIVRNLTGRPEQVLTAEQLREQPAAED